LSKIQNDSALPSRPSSVLFRSYKLDSASLGLSNIRWRYLQLPNLYRAVHIKYISLYPICVISHVSVMRPSCKFNVSKTLSRQDTIYNILQDTSW